MILGTVSFTILFVSDQFELIVAGVKPKMTSYSYNPKAPLRALTQSFLVTAIIAMLLLVPATNDKPAFQDPYDIRGDRAFFFVRPPLRFINSPWNDREVRQRDYYYGNKHYEYSVHTTILHDTDDSPQEPYLHLNFPSGNMHYIYSACYMHNHTDDSQDDQDVFRQKGFLFYRKMPSKYRVCYMHNARDDSRDVLGDLWPSTYSFFVYQDTDDSQDGRNVFLVRNESSTIIHSDHDTLDCWTSPLIDEPLFCCIDAILEDGEPCRRTRVNEAAGKVLSRADVLERVYYLRMLLTARAARVCPTLPNTDARVDRKSFQVAPADEFAGIPALCNAMVMVFSPWIITIVFTGMLSCASCLRKTSYRSLKARTKRTLKEMPSRARCLLKPSYLSMRAEVKEMVFVEFAVMSACTSAAHIGPAECKMKSSSLGSCCVEVYCTAESDSKQGDIICYQHENGLVYTDQNQQTNTTTGLLLEVVFQVLEGVKINCCSVIKPFITHVSECNNFVDENPVAPVITSTQPISDSPESSTSAHLMKTKSSSTVHQNLPSSPTTLSNLQVDSPSDTKIKIIKIIIISVFATLMVTLILMVIFAVTCTRRFISVATRIEEWKMTTVYDGVNENDHPV